MPRKNRQHSTPTGKFVFCNLANVAHGPIACEIMRGPNSLWSLCVNCGTRAYYKTETFESHALLKRCFTPQQIEAMGGLIPTKIDVAPKKPMPLPHMLNPRQAPPPPPPRRPGPHRPSPR